MSVARVAPAVYIFQMMIR